MAANPNSILDSVKQTIGVDADYTAFDIDVIIFINSAFGSLKQLGVGAESGFAISDNTTLWEQYTQDIVYLGMIKQFIIMSVRLAFDPPATSFGIDAVRKQLEELTFRINVEAENINPPSDPFGLEEEEVKSLYEVKTMTLAMAATIVPDASVANTFYLTLTGDTTIVAPIYGVDGQHVTLEIISNGHTVTWGNGWNFGAAGTPTLSTGGLTDVISAVYRESSAKWLAGFSQGF